MAVLLNTSAGDLVIDLFVDECPIACKNFVKLCAIKYYNACLIFNVQQNYLVQSGDPTGTGNGGNSIYGIVKKEPMFCFRDEIHEKRKLNKIGFVGYAHASNKPDTNRSQFFITLRGEDMDHLSAEFTIFGEIAEGFEVLEKLNNLYCDESGRPYQDVRILHTYILDDPYPEDMHEEIELLASSPIVEYPKEEKVKRRLPYEDPSLILEEANKAKTNSKQPELLEAIRKKEAQSRAVVLEMLGDLPDADVAPPREVS